MKKEYTNSRDKINEPTIKIIPHVGYRIGPRYQKTDAELLSLYTKCCSSYDKSVIVRKLGDMPLEI